MSTYRIKTGGYEGVPNATGVRAGFRLQDLVAVEFSEVVVVAVVRRALAGELVPTVHSRDRCILVHLVPSGVNRPPPQGPMPPKTLETAL